MTDLNRKSYKQFKKKQNEKLRKIFSFFKEMEKL